MENLDYKYHLKGGSYSGVPKFIAETLSPGTAMRDKTIKKDIYEKCGIEEYWILSPNEKGIEIYYLKEKGYELVNSYILEDDSENEHYNVNKIISLRGFPDINMTLGNIFEGLD